jgi:hypothetical protein
MVGPSPFFGSQKISGTENMTSFDTEISLNDIIQFPDYKRVYNIYFKNCTTEAKGA